jgi:ornithine cyclodeaminase/alanine dehydrogenase-like protein (mu-crystallin family)
MTGSGVSFVTRGEIERALPIERCLEMARVAYEALADGRALSSSLSHVVAPRGEFLVKSSGLYVDDRLFVTVKVVAYFEHRPADLGLPSIVGLIQLLDGETGEPLAVMESGLITTLRTAAGTAVAINCLARADARRLLICGTGEQVLSHVEAIAAIRNLEVVQIWGRSHVKAAVTVEALREHLPHARIEAVNDLSIAASGSDLIVCLTSATVPYLDAADIRPGTTIAAVGSDSPEKGELSVDLLATSALVCDVTDQCATVGELHHALDAGVISIQGVRAEIGQVLNGSAGGRMSDREIVVFDSTGTAVQDTAPAVAAYLFAHAAKRVDLWAP